MSFHMPESMRVRGSALHDGNNGWFALPSTASTRPLTVIASDGMGWEHVSAKAHQGANKTRIPTWGEMCYVVFLFWDAEDVVMQLHPPRSQWVNCHPSVLHLWRPTHVPIPLPDPVLVGLLTQEA